MKVSTPTRSRARRPSASPLPTIGRSSLSRAYGRSRPRAAGWSAATSCIGAALPFAMATSLKARAMLTLSYGYGLRASEVARLRAGDIDSEQMIIRIVQSKGRKDRPAAVPFASRRTAGLHSLPLSFAVVYRSLPSAGIFAASRRNEEALCCVCAGLDHPDRRRGHHVARNGNALALPGSAERAGVAAARSPRSTSSCSIRSCSAARPSRKAMSPRPPQTAKDRHIVPAALARQEIAIKRCRPRRRTRARAGRLSDARGITG